MNLLDRIILPRETKELIKLNEIIQELNEIMEKKNLKRLSERLNGIKGYEEEVALYKSMIETLCQR